MLPEIFTQLRVPVAGSNFGKMILVKKSAVGAKVTVLTTESIGSPFGQLHCALEICGKMIDVLSQTAQIILYSLNIGIDFSFTRGIG
jgi:hypothetical protein